MPDHATPFLHDIPLGRAQSEWRRYCASAGCPARVEPVRVTIDRAVGRVTAEPIWAARSSPPFDSAAMDGIAVNAADTLGASESVPLLLAADAYAVVDTGDPLPERFDAVVMREDVHYADGRAELRAAVAPYQHVRSIGVAVARDRRVSIIRRAAWRLRHSRDGPPDPMNVPIGPADAQLAAADLATDAWSRS